MSPRIRCICLAAQSTYFSISGRGGWSVDAAIIIKAALAVKNWRVANILSASNSMHGISHIECFEFHEIILEICGVSLSEQLNRYYIRIFCILVSRSRQKWIVPAYLFGPHLLSHINPFGVFGAFMTFRIKSPTGARNISSPVKLASKICWYMFTDEWFMRGTMY